MPSKALMKKQASLSELEGRIGKIEDRNQKVEIDKEWETSLFRRLVLLALTYLSIGVYMNAIGIEHAWLNAVIPAIGFMLSTLTLPLFKSVWLKMK